jgi:hypothetical protein
MPEEKNGKVENGDDIFVKDKLEFMAQLKIRTKILNALRQNFKVEEMWVISEKPLADKEI